ncbi:MAG: PD40 domain-containing protein [Planctomycetes bacterium]|nr:PD40 domain-containing protein [Planctomycetota bacterium]
MQHVLAVLAVAGLAGILGSGVSLADKPPGGGTPPPGRIHFATYTRVLTPIGWTELFSGSWSMKSDGTDKLADRRGDPTQGLHGSLAQRWFLETLPVEGAYWPNGLQAHELFATSADGAIQRRLTDDPSVEIVPHYRQQWSWAKDDSSVSYAAVTWTPTGPGEGNFADARGQEWLVDAALFRAAVDWSTGVPLAAAPAALLDLEIHFDSVSDGDNFHPRPTLAALDWSAAGDQVVYEWVTNRTPGAPESHELRVTSFDASGIPAGTTSLGFGRAPAWSPAASRIAYFHTNSDLAPNWVIWTVSPEGTGFFQVTSTAQNYDRNPEWSPDGAQIAFERGRQTTQKGTTTYIWDVLRVPAAGGSPVDLTKDIADNAYAGAWR